VRTSTRISPRLGRLAGAAAILFVPLAVLLVVMVTQAGEAGGAAQAGTAGLAVDAQSAARWAVAAGLVMAGAVVGGTLLRRR
jgi:hypothetical protein